MTDEDIIAALDAIDSSDPETAHSNADDLIAAALSSDIAAAYHRVIDRCSWWACA